MDVQKETPPVDRRFLSQEAFFGNYVVKSKLDIGQNDRKQLELASSIQLNQKTGRIF